LPTIGIAGWHAGLVGTIFLDIGSCPRVTFTANFTKRLRELFQISANGADIGVAPLRLVFLILDGECSDRLCDFQPRLPGLRHGGQNSPSWERHSSRSIEQPSLRGARQRSNPDWIASLRSQ
jgi:hypothetical protein